MLKTMNKPERPSVVIKPIPGACVKTKTSSGEKIFLNICQTTEIPPPDDISETKLIELMEDENPSYCIPMSIGQEKTEVDKSGAPCLAYDIAINTTYFEKSEKSRLFWSFTIAVIIQGVSQKFDKDIELKNYTVLKNRKVLGRLQDHRIEKREVKKAMRAPLIEELPSINSTSVSQTKISTSKPIEESRESKSRVTPTPDYIILREPKEGKPKRLIGKFKIKSLISADDIAVDVGEDRIMVEARKIGYLIDIFVPYSIEQEKVSAILDKDVGILQLNMPVAHE
ncbi:PIH1 domain-containing protein 1 isoform X2 [Cephus cinctus]|nr:PIH1 domain-containing protein 1 isoform X2 [Cephus cinctus]